MKKIISSLVMAILALVSVNAQQISVVSPTGETTIYRTLPEAIEGAADGSVVYLPGGGFSISDDVKITKKLTIIGIGHKSNNGNVDGITTISGNLFFNEGSSESAVMGCYITGYVNIGDEGATVNDVLIRYCNLYSVQIKNNKCMETIVNQNYVRNPSWFGDTNAQITYNIMVGFTHVNGGLIKNNIITRWGDAYVGDMNCIHNSYITKNIWRGVNVGAHGYSISNNNFYDNLGSDFGDNGIAFDEGITMNDIFVDWNDIPSSEYNYHFKNDYMKYSDYGVYANGEQFDNQLAPVPYIIYKDIPEQTDSEGKLKIQIRVKANQ